jgi:hypothetical protein
MTITLDDALFLHALGVAALCVVTVVVFIGVTAMAIEAITD